MEDVLKFSQLEYMGAFSFASGLAITFVWLYILSMNARVKDLAKFSQETIKAAEEREEKAVDMQVQLVSTVQEQAKIIDKFMRLEGTVEDLGKRVIRLEV